MLAQGLLKEPDIELTLLFENLDSNGQGVCFQTLKDWNIKYQNLNIKNGHGLMDRLGRKTGLFDLPKHRLRAQIKRFLEEQGHFDWVITYNYTFIPFVDVFHECGSRVLFSERNDGGWLFKIKGLAGYVSTCDIVTCNSQAAQSLIKEKLNITPHYIKNGVALADNQFTPSDRPVTQMLITARLSPEKNQKLLLDGLCCEPMTDVQLVVCGRVSSQAYADEITVYIHQNGLADRVNLVGFQTDMRPYYQKAGCVVLPSYYEGTPNAILEAYANGIPVIASKITMNMPLFEDMNLLFDPDQVQELVAAFTYLRNMSQSVRCERVLSNYELVKKEYSPEKMVYAFRTLLKSST